LEKNQEDEQGNDGWSETKPREVKSSDWQERVYDCE